MYFPDRERGEIRRIAPNGAVTRVAGELKAIRWLHATPAGTLYVVDGSDLVRIRGGRAVRLVRNLTSAARHTVMGLWTDAAENVYVADNEHRVVKRVTAAGVVTVFARSTAPWSPTGGTFAANGDLWLLEASTTNAVRVRRIAVVRR
jgi:sugar lactone lactonase YvrE